MAWRSTSTSSTEGHGLLEVGRVTKPHGVRGEVVVVLTTDRTERLDVGAVLHTAGGSLTVVASRPHQRSWLVSFAGVHDRTAADALRGTVLLALPIEDPGAMWVHELIGAAVVDAAGTQLGTVESIEANPAADLLVLDGGGLIPMSFVVDTAPGRITVEIPEGLLE